MCTLVVLHRPGHPWPVLIAANRDERLDRAWDSPGAWWPERPTVIGGRDRDGGGTWLAARRGIVAGVLNRPGSLGPAAGKRSRGELPLLALDAESAAEGVRRMAVRPIHDWRPFNLVVADRQGAWFLRGPGAGLADAIALPEGVSMVTAHDPNDPASPRTARHLPRFRAAPPPDPDNADWAAWEALLADAGGTPAEALCVPPTDGFGTVCASLLAIAADGRTRWRFAPGPSGAAAFGEVPVA